MHVFCVLFLLHAQFLGIFSQGKNSGPVGKLTFKSMDACEDFVAPDEEMVIETLVRNEDNKNVVDYYMKIPYDFDSTMPYTLTIFKMEGSEWDHVFDYDGVLNDLNAYAQQAWDKFRNQVVPPLADPKTMPAGEYNLTGFYDGTPQDLTVNPIFYGTLKVIVIVIKDDVDIICRELIIESNPMM